MDLRLLCLVILLGVFGFCNAQQEGSDCIKANAQTCGECIQVSEKCGWCTDITFLKRGEPNSVRCDELASLIKRGCEASKIEDPRGETKVLQSNLFTILKDGAEKLPPEQITQIQPQKLSLNLRSGEPQTFSLKFKLADSLSSEVILENGRLPRGVSITYKSICKNGVVGTGENGRKCSKISIGDEVSFEVSIESRQCPSRGKPKTIKIKPLGSTEEVEIVLNFICECDCHKDRQPNSEICTRGNGTFECGTCRCNEGRIGRQCECSTEEVRTDDLYANCLEDNETDICSNNGDCVCGTCECKRRDNPEEHYSGKFCQCDNFNCDRANNKQCGGHGRCECRVCVCDANYTGSACDCSLDTSTCMAANEQICNGRGSCQCGVCKCTDSRFQGPTCEICPTCPGVCTLNRDCVQCLAFGTGEKKDTCERDCQDINLIRIKDREHLPQPDQSYPLFHCKERDANDCWFYFTYAVRENQKEVHVVETLGNQCSDFKTDVMGALLLVLTVLQVNNGV